jgi:molybdopterin-containing oxidoreductase family iron-sulfur binding subunit
VSRTYWRSLGQIEDSPESRAFLEREFPKGASELPEGVTRREMMMLLGASLSLAGIAGCRRPVEEIVPYVTAPEDSVPGIPRHYTTTMPFRRSAYGLIVESHEGRPTKIEGNPSHPSTLGASGSLVQASVLGLYDPDRSQSVMQQGARKSWSDFVTAWGQLSEAHAADGGLGLAVLSESFSSPTLARLASEFRARYPRAIWATYEAVSDENRLAGIRSATGRDLDLLLRFDQASVILALDADPLLTDPEMIRHARGFADGRRAGTSGGVMNRLYAVEGVYSLTGAMADHRLRLESRQIAPFLAALAARLVPPAAGAASPTGSGVPGNPGVRPPSSRYSCASGAPRCSSNSNWYSSSVRNARVSVSASMTGLEDQSPGFRTGITKRNRRRQSAPIALIVGPPREVAQSAL